MLQALREFFAVARAQGYMHTDNPMKRLEATPKISKEEEKARQKPRKRFTLSQVNTVFASEWYNPNARHWTGKMSKDLAGRYWGPLISLCHGVRVREIVQLVNSDFSLVDEILLITVQTILEATDDSASLPERKLKKFSTFRTIPVHPRLCSVGLPEFIRDMQSAHPPSTPLFPSAIPNPGGKSPLWGRAYEEAFLRFVRDGLAFGRGYGNHSFRHLFEDELRDAQVVNGTWPSGLGEFVSGRTLPRAVDKQVFLQQSSAVDYGDGFVAEHIQRFVGQIAFEGVVFPTPYYEWLKRRTS